MNSCENLQTELFALFHPIFRIFRTLHYFREFGMSVLDIFLLFEKDNTRLCIC